MDDADPFAWLCGGEDVLALRPSRVPLGSLLAEDAAFACSEDPGFLPVSYTHLTLPTNREV